MAIQPITDSEGRVLINGALVGSQVWDAEFAVILLLKLERFEKALPVIGQTPPVWNPIMLADNSTREDSAIVPHGGDAPAGLHETEPAVHMIQIAVPAQEALKLGWALTETAQQILQAKPTDGPIS
jgi:hypothetical protein